MQKTGLTAHLQSIWIYPFVGKQGMDDMSMSTSSCNVQRCKAELREMKGDRRGYEVRKHQNAPVYSEPISMFHSYAPFIPAILLTPIKTLPYEHRRRAHFFFHIRDYHRMS